MNIRTKLFLTNGVVVILLIASLTFYLDHYGRGVILKKSKENTGYSLSQISENVDNALKSYEQIADSLYTDILLQDLMLKRYTSFPEAHKDYFESIVPKLTAIQSFKEMKGLTLYTNNDSFQIGSIKPLEAMPDHAAAGTCLSGGVATAQLRSWSVVVAPNGERQLRLIQRLNQLNTSSCLFAEVAVSTGIIQDLVKKESGQHQFYIFMPNGNIVLQRLLGEPVPALASGYWFYGDLRDVNDSKVVRHNKQDYLLTNRTLDSRSSVMNMQIVSLLPLNELVKQTQDIRTTAILLFVLTLLVFLIVNYITAAGLTKRLRQLSAKLRSTDMDHLQPIAVVRGRDEVSHLGHMFNGMVLRMQRLIGEVFESELARKELALKTKESELYALQTQINPHYLYNTLNAIRGNLLENGDRHNAEIISLLARSFRHVLGKSSRLIPISEELVIVGTYLRIQSFRFSDRLTYRIELDADLQRYMIPKLALQILVENAIVHALEPNPGSTCISIRGWQVDDTQVRLLVEDDGPDIPPERLEAIRLRLLEEEAGAEQADDSSHIGLANVHNRLRSFGEAYGVSLESRPGRGTTVSLLLPTHSAHSTYSTYKKERMNDA